MTSGSLVDSLPILLASIITILAWLILIVIALSRLYKRDLDEIAKAIWVLIILVIPILGPLAYIFMNRGGQKTNKQ